MNKSLSDYVKITEDVLQENPVLTLEKLLKKTDSTISAGELIQFNLKLTKVWNNYSKYGLEIVVVLTECDDSGKSIIYNYDFNNDISEIIKKGNKQSNIYYLNKKFEIIDTKKGNFSIDRCSIMSKEMRKILIHLGIKGSDIFINGILYSSDNFFKSYKDVMNTEGMISIFEYKKLINDFYEKNIKYDPNKRYFLCKDDIPKNIHSETIEKYPKILKNKPEQYFQIDFVRYLRDNCKDTVSKEYITDTGDRYDILVTSEENEVFVFEIKWLGRSITSSMKVFNNYNSSDRAISGAYQLLDYVTCADKYKEYFGLPIYCAILLVFDARDEETKIDYPEEILKYANIDLDNKLFMYRKKINASNVYNIKKKM